MRESSCFRVRFGACTVFLTVMLAGCAQNPPTPTPPPAAPAASIQTTPLKPVQSIERARAAAPGMSLRHDAPLRYVVKKGDTLWGIAGRFLNKPWQWPVLWYGNFYIHNPHLIYPGEVLKLMWVNGRPRLGSTRTKTEVVHPRVYVTPEQQSVPTIPYAAIRLFLNGPRVVDADQIDSAPYIVTFTRPHLIGSAGDGIFVKNLPQKAKPVWSLVHIGKAYHDADSGELLGYEAIPVGRALLRKAGSVATMRITRTDREAQIGDRLLPIVVKEFHANFFPHAPKGPVDGSIISVFGGLNEIARHQIVTLDRGSRNGLDVGTVLRIYQPGRDVPDPHGGAGSTVHIPAQPAGLVMVFKVSTHISYALVMKETRAVHVLDRVGAPGPSSNLPRGG